MMWKSTDFEARGCSGETGRGVDHDADALFELGVTSSTGAAPDLVAAHKWFNLAAVAGQPAAADARADVADVMTARQIAEAQRQARAWLSQVSLAGQRLRAA